MFSYYEELGVSRAASKSEIKTAYRSLGKKYHPDVHPGDKKFAENKMKKINIAYEVLSDPIKKSKYDLTFANSYLTNAYGYRNQNNPDSYVKTQDFYGTRGDTRHYRSATGEKTGSRAGENAGHRTSESTSSADRVRNKVHYSEKASADIHKKSGLKVVKISIEMKEELYKKALEAKGNAHTEQDFLIAAELFKKIIGYKNAYFTGVECEKTAARMKIDIENTANKEILYIQAVEMKITGNTEYGFLKAFGIFGRIKGYKGSDELARECLALARDCK